MVVWIWCTIVAPLIFLFIRSIEYTYEKSNCDYIKLTNEILNLLVEKIFHGMMIQTSFDLEMQKRLIKAVEVRTDDTT
jgi:hypothetical protein